MLLNPLTLTDSYKYSHYRQTPPGTTHIYSYFESRGAGEDKHPAETVFFGLQYLLKEYLQHPFTGRNIEEVEELCKLHFGTDQLFNSDGFHRLLQKHNGSWPVEIRAVREGTVVPTGNVLMTVENTDPEFPWVTNFLETLLVQVWYPTTVATVSYNVRKIIAEALVQSGDLAGLPFKLHDFGCRGVSSMESAMIGGMAHLVNFMGTDTFPAIIGAREYYREAMAGFSIPAAEHSTITSWGEAGEVRAYQNMLEKYPTGLVAVVSDSWDIRNAVSEIWGRQLHDQVMMREGTVVIRPDSGDPATIVLQTLNDLGERFGYTVNTKGFKVLDSHVRVIQGDGCNPQSIDEILYVMTSNDWSAENVAFGMGGALLQKVDRDTFNFAFKCSSMTIDGKDRDVFKRPKTATWKNSKAGRMKLVLDGKYQTITSTESHPGPDQLQLVYRNGQLFNKTTLSEVRNRAYVTVSV